MGSLMPVTWPGVSALDLQYSSRAGCLSQVWKTVPILPAKWSYWLKGALARKRRLAAPFHAPSSEKTSS